ncbi:MAG: hypothetical protein ACRD2N_05790, partial [Vicinamibacterales bacterium]
MLTRGRAIACRWAAGIAICLLAEASIRSQPLSPRNVNYDIDVALDPPARTITGAETIEWRNSGAIAAYSLRLHLYWNAFRHTNSTWLKQYRLGGGTGFDNRRESDFGHVEITGFQILGAGGAAPHDLTSEVRYISPDDQNAEDRSLAAVTLPTPVAPGETLR